MPARLDSLTSDRTVRLLVSVRDAAEAVAAVEGGADIIDVKDPARGPLGMASARAIEAVVDAVNGRAPVSVALGELRDAPDVAPLARVARTGIAFAKAGLHGERGRNWQDRLSAVHGQLPSVAPVAVLYSDCLDGPARDRCPDWPAVVEWGQASGAAGVLVDTYHKDGRGLFGGHADGPNASGASREALELAQHGLAEGIRMARSAGMFVALAGQLSGASLERALALRPDVIAVRGAVCIGEDRRARVEAARVGAIKKIIEVSRAGTRTSASALRAG